MTPEEYSHQLRVLDKKLHRATPHSREWWNVVHQQQRATREYFEFKGRHVERPENEQTLCAFGVV